MGGGTASPAWSTDPMHLPLPPHNVCPCRPPVWLLVGLGARGLVYHAWLGRLAATAVLEGSEHGLAPELLAWKELVVDPLAS